MIATHQVRLRPIESVTDLSAIRARALKGWIVQGIQRAQIVEPLLGVGGGTRP